MKDFRYIIELLNYFWAEQYRETEAHQIIGCIQGIGITRSHQ